MTAANHSPNPLNSGDFQSPNDQHAATDTEMKRKTTRRDLSKFSLIISLISLVLVAIFFFGLSQNIRGLSREMQEYKALKNTVTSLDAYVGDIVTQMGHINAQLLDMDERSKDMVVQLLTESMLNDMLQKTSYLSSQLDNTIDRDKLQRIQELLQELRHQTANTPAAATDTAPLPTPSEAIPSVETPATPEVVIPQSKEQIIESAPSEEKQPEAPDTEAKDEQNDPDQQVAPSSELDGTPKTMTQ